MTRAASPSYEPRLSTAAAPLGSFVLLTLRILLGGIFCLAGFLKFRDPQTFYEAINAFQLVRDSGLVLLGTHVLPPIEIVAGLALILGFWTRAAAFVIGGLLVVFIAAVIGAINKGLAGIPCSCFGYFHLLCKDGVGWCKVGENLAMTGIAAALVVFGGGFLSLDWAFLGRRRPGI